MEACRLDKQIFVSDMLDMIYREITKADFIVADMSTRNPNVFYEVGYADAMRKPVILLTNKAEDIPFDLQHRPHVIYESIGQLKTDLTERMNWLQQEIGRLKKEPLKSTVKVVSSLIERTEYSDSGVLQLRIEIHNALSAVSEKINSIYLYAAKGWHVVYDNKACDKTDTGDDKAVERHIVHPSFGSIPPQDWLPIDVKMKRNLSFTWDAKGPRKDTYHQEGILRIAINTDTQKNVQDHKLSIDFVLDNLPF